MLTTVNDLSLSKNVRLKIIFVTISSIVHEVFSKIQNSTQDRKMYIFGPMIDHWTFLSLISNTYDHMAKINF